MKRPLPPNLATVSGHPPHRRPHASAALQTGPNNNKNRGACWAEDATMWNYYGSLSTDKGSDNVLKLTFEFVYANDASPARKQANNSLAIPCPLSSCRSCFGPHMPHMLHYWLYPYTRSI